MSHFFVPGPIPPRESPRNKRLCQGVFVVGPCGALLHGGLLRPGREALHDGAEVLQADVAWHFCGKPWKI